MNLNSLQVTGSKHHFMEAIPNSPGQTCCYPMQWFGSGMSPHRFMSSNTWSPEGGTETVLAFSADLTFWAPGLLLCGEPLSWLPASTEIPHPNTHKRTHTHMPSAPQWSSVSGKGVRTNPFSIPLLLSRILVTRMRKLLFLLSS